MSVHRSACPLDCPDACTLQVTVKDGRVQKVTGDDRNPLTRGHLCGKVTHFARHMYCPERLATPLFRTGARGSGSFREASWDEALDRVADAMRDARDRHGGESILPCSYGGSNGYLTEGSYNRRLFSRLGASKLRRDLCAMTAGAAHSGLYGRMPGVALTDFVHAQLIVVWGCNPHATGVHLVSRIQEAQRRGAKLVVVDPRRTQLARRADLHLAPRPGTDMPVALAVAKWLFDHGRADLDFLDEHCDGVSAFRELAEGWPTDRAAAAAGVDGGAIEAFAALYADSSPAVIRCGWGIERNRNGCSSVASVLALPAVAGKFGVRGGGFTASNTGAWAFDPEAAAGADPQPTRTVNLGQLGPALNELRDPAIHALYVYNGNPAANCPDQAAVRRGLLREDLFVVVHDAVMTDTARYADVVLPATTFLEHHELARGYGAYVLNRMEPVVDPYGESRSNAQVFDALLDRLGLGREGDVREPAAMTAAIVGQHEGGRRLLGELDRDAVAVPATGATPIQMVDVHPMTPSGRIELVPATLDASMERGLYTLVPERTSGFPLTLISPADRRAVTSTCFQLVDGIAEVRVHPDDASSRCIGQGDRVRIFNDLGEVHCRARVTDGTRPGVVWMPKGLWAKHTETGDTSNALIAARMTDVGGTPAFNDTRVEIEPLRN